MHTPFLFLPSVQPPGTVQISSVTKRALSYNFAASPTPGATYKVTFTPKRDGIPALGPLTLDISGFRTTSGLIPDVTYTLRMVAVLNGKESTPVSAVFTTTPDGKPSCHQRCFYIHDHEGLT